MCGVPGNRLSTYTDMLNDRGFDVVIAEQSGNERRTELLLSQHKDAPVESVPVGRIEYLGSNGEVGECIEYIDEAEFIRDIMEENHYGTPMSIKVYRHEDGSTIARTLRNDSDPPPQGFEIIDAPVPEQIPSAIDEPEQATPDERFHVVELDRGARIAYGIWDDLQDGYYVDEDGVGEEFSSEWQAAGYLAELNKQFADKKAEKDAAPVEQEAAALEPPKPQRKPRAQSFVLHRRYHRRSAIISRIADDALGVGTPGERFRTISPPSGCLNSSKKKTALRHRLNRKSSPVMWAGADKHNFLIHDYFFARTLDKVRPGGVIAFITSKGTLDKENPNVRKYIAQRADLLGAIRLPNDTFKAAAGTEVTSDIIFLQKRDRLVDIEPDWVHLATDANGIRMNAYFVDNPEMVLGDIQMVSGPHGMESTCIAYENAELGDLLRDAIQNIHAEITEFEIDDLEAEDEDLSIPADPDVRNFSFTVVDGKIYYRENSRMNPVDISATAESRIKGMIAIRDCVRTLIEYQTEDYPDADIKAEQEKLNRLYDDFSKEIRAYQRKSQQLGIQFRQLLLPACFAGGAGR